ncbi:MAG: ABC transporter ATP-binding protein, partial [Deltaproteobacteria bacterium]
PSPTMFFKRYPHEFSGGMRQRAMIAMALVCNPKILIADEPTTALDVTIEAQILELLESIKSEFNKSMIYISHDLAVIGEISDRILVMYLGRVVESGVADEVIDNPLHPYTRALLKSIPKIDQPIESLEPIEGSIPSPFEVHTGCPFYSRCTERLGEICLRQKPDNKTYNNGHTVSCHLHA